MPVNENSASRSRAAETQTVRVLVHGLAYFSQKLPAFLAHPGWEFRNYPPRWSSHLAATLYDLSRCDLVYTWGGRLTLGKFLLAARSFRKQKLVMFWCGSDVLEARPDFEAGRTAPWIADKTHWAGAPWLAEEVRAMGLKCEYVPTTWIESVQELPALPRKFTVLAYLPDAARVSLYGIDQVLEVARALPAIDFIIVGLQPGQTLLTPSNVTLNGRVAYLEPFYRASTVVWRPTRHDGLSFMALEALARGRHVMWSYPFPTAIHTPDAASAREQLERLLALHESKQLELNRTGVDYILQHFSPEKIKTDMLNRWRQIVEAPSALPSSAPSRA